MLIFLTSLHVKRVFSLSLIHVSLFIQTYHEYDMKNSQSSRIVVVGTTGSIFCFCWKLTSYLSQRLRFLTKTRRNGHGHTVSLLNKSGNDGLLWILLFIFHELYLYNKALTATKAENIQSFFFIRCDSSLGCGSLDPT